VFEFGKALLAHCLHEQFFFDDDPCSLIIGFVCSCSGEDQKWVISLSELKIYPPEVNNVIKSLRDRAKDPDGSWHKMQQIEIEIEKDSKDRHRAFMRKQRIGALVVAIEYQLKNKRISASKRKRLQRRRSKLKRSVQ
jgi:hypothetical protein